MRSQAKTAKHDEVEALVLIEEGVHLLRQLPLAHWLPYLMGTGGWCLALLWFWAHTTWFNPAPELLALHAFGLTIAYGILKLAQAHLAGALMALRTGDTAPRRTIRQWAGLYFSELAAHGPGVLILPLACILTFPAGWVWAWFQSRTVLAGTSADAPSRADHVALTLATPKQVHFSMLYLSVLWVIVWANVAIVAVLLPRLANSWLGLDTFAGVTGTSLFNSTFFACTLVVSWAIVDPVTKAFFCLRVFVQQSRETGRDIRVELRRVASRSRKQLTIALLVLAGLTALPTPVVASNHPAPPPTATSSVIPSDTLERELRHVLQTPEFEWQLRPKRDARFRESNRGPIERLFAAGVRKIIDVFQWIGDAWDRLTRWWRDLFPDSSSKPSGVSASALSVVANVLLYGLLIVVVGLLGYLLYATFRRMPRKSPQTKAGVAVAVPDLTDERVHAALLPWQEWLILARERRQAGEWRLALRALFLAQLARLSAEGVLSLARHKTNLEYEREMRRRLPGLADRHAHFRGRRLLFEEVWYGYAQASADAVDAWLAELEASR
ncbi:MAG: hypothetical protein SFV32_04320 [Opitutaceae bacterium]|nr:hypothetical protein [Opitutaceae bacterium]